MKKLFLMVAAIAVAVGLAACAPARLDIPADGVTRIDITSLPTSETYARTYTSSDKVDAVMAYLNGLSLRADFPETPGDYAGQTYVIDITYADGGRRTVYHSGNMFICEEGGDWYRMTYDEAAELDAIIRGSASD